MVVQFPSKYVATKLVQHYYTSFFFLCSQQSVLHATSKRKKHNPETKETTAEPVTI